MRFVITSHGRLLGVALSLRGQWGGKRYPDAAQAEKVAKEHAGSTAFTIEREQCK